MKRFTVRYTLLLAPILHLGVNKADCHMDGIILEPTLYLDDEMVIDKGRFVV